MSENILVHLNVLLLQALIWILYICVYHSTVSGWKDYLSARRKVFQSAAFYLKSSTVLCQCHGTECPMYLSSSTLEAI